MAQRLASGRREELLGGVMRVIAVRGFREVKVSELAKELHCSVSSLYKIAPSKDSLILLAINHWAASNFPELERRAARQPTAAARAREYFNAGAQAIGTLSSKFRADAQQFESTRIQWSAVVTEPFIRRLVELLDLAEEAGEIRPVNSYFMAEMLRNIAWLMRDERLLQAAGLTAEQAGIEVNEMIWGGICQRDENGVSRC